MKRVLVTGAAGFIGFHLCSRLLNEGIEVIGIDKCNHNLSDSIEEQRLDFIGRNALFQFINKPIEKIDIDQIEGKIDALYYNSEEIPFDSDKEQIKKIIEKKISNLKKIIPVCIPNHTKFIYTSTIDVYGSESRKIDESTPTNPTSSLGQVKLAEEEYLLSEKSIHKVILRMPLIFGPFQSLENPISQLFFAKNNGKELENVQRNDVIDLLFIDDAVEALILASQSENISGIFNITNDPPNQWVTVIKWFQDRSDTKEITDPPVNRISNEKAKKLLKFKPNVPIDEGLSKLEEYFKKTQRLV